MATDIPDIVHGHTRPNIDANMAALSRRERRGDAGEASGEAPVGPLGEALAGARDDAVGEIVGEAPGEAKGEAKGEAPGGVSGGSVTAREAKGEAYGGVSGSVTARELVWGETPLDGFGFDWDLVRRPP